MKSNYSVKTFDLLNYGLTNCLYFRPLDVSGMAKICCYQISYLDSPWLRPKIVSTSMSSLKQRWRCVIVLLIGCDAVVAVLRYQRSHNPRKFPQIFAVSVGVVLGIMRILCIPFKILLFG